MGGCRSERRQPISKIGDLPGAVNTLVLYTLVLYTLVLYT